MSQVACSARDPLASAAGPDAMLLGELTADGLAAEITVKLIGTDQI